MYDSYNLKPQLGKTRPTTEDIGPWLVALGLALLALALSLGFAIFDEPYHIDELRQVGYYDQGYSDIARSAVSQEQPPLDYWIGALTRKVLGRPSDAAERAPAALFAFMAGLGASVLLLQAGKHDIAPLPPAVLALSPLFLTFGVYARPYALPLALSVWFLVAVGWWRRSRRYLSIGPMILFSCLLPLSRTTEPVIFLGSTLLVMVLCAVVDRPDRWPIPPLLSALLGLLVAIPVLDVISRETAEYQSEGLNGLGIVLTRLGEATDTVLAGHPAAVLLIAGMAAAISIASGYLLRQSTEMWWYLPLAATPLGSLLAFGLLASPAIPYFTRYSFFFALPLALGFAFTFGWLRERRIHPGVRVVGSALIVVAVIVAGVPATVRALSVETNPDYRTASRAVATEVATGRTLLYEEGTSVTDYRNPYFPGHPRYLDFPVYESYTAARDQHPLGTEPIIILSQGPSLEVQGWATISIDGRFFVYVPSDELRWGDPNLASGLRALCESGQVENYGYLCVLAAQALAAASLSDSARTLLLATEQRAQGEGVLQYFGSLFDPDVSLPAHE